MMSQIVLFTTVLQNLDSLSSMRIRQVQRTKMRIQLREKEEIKDDMLIDDFLSLDSEAETSETLTELDILERVKNKNNTAMNCDEDEDDEEGNDHDAEINKPSHDEILKSFETIRRGLQFENKRRVSSDRLVRTGFTQFKCIKCMRILVLQALKTSLLGEGQVVGALSRSGAGLQLPPGAKIPDKT
ncbi:hypothetical protein AVEN_4728-1 [Araneus ventricosus]|uniref:Uncharacterized protein n=1 Tax=Araneus ventricosus TaxID=182803 RepID=A0A4Y2HFQ6_ARAVE|nr:hypothetical protein AVEN_4728-1 [Araneus ventricosus]